MPEPKALCRPVTNLITRMLTLCEQQTVLSVGLHQAVDTHGSQSSSQTSTAIIRHAGKIRDLQRHFLDNLKLKKGIIMTVL